MSSKKFRFVSPGVFLNEIDNSALPTQANAQGPVIIGRFEKGPGMRPVIVDSLSELVETFGYPIAGRQGGDVWRDGNRIGPTYAAFAAEAWLKAGVGPATIVRLMGVEHPDKTAAGRAGWDTDLTITALQGTNGGAYGLFIWDSGSQGSGVSSPSGTLASAGTEAATHGPMAQPLTGALAAVWYLTTGSIELIGRLRGATDGEGSYTGTGVANSSVGTFSSGTCALFESVGASQEFRAIIRDGQSTVVKDTTFNFDRSSDLYIRKKFNTNPQMTNGTITQTQNKETYWLGETYERHLATYVSGSGTSKNHGAILGIMSGSSTVLHKSDMRMAFRDAETGWFFSQDITTNSGSFQPQDQQKLFKLVGLNYGEWIQNNLKVSIEDITYSKNSQTDYGTFSVVLRRQDDHDGATQIVERYTSLSLDPNSANYIARRIGNAYQEWNATELRYIYHGEYENLSRYIRVEMDEDVHAGITDAEYLPFGFFGPLREVGFSVFSGSRSVHKFGATTLDETSLTDASHNPKVYARGNDDIPRSLADPNQVNADGDPIGIPGVAGADMFINVGHGAAGGGGSHKSGSCPFTGSVIFPTIALRATASTTDEYFGYDSTRAGATVTVFDESNIDVLRAKPAGETQNPTSAGAVAGGGVEISCFFTLDDVRVSGSGQGYYTSGSRQVNSADATAKSVDLHSATAMSGTYKQVLDKGFDRFTAPFYGGYDGLNIRESEPFRNSQFDSSESRLDQYAFHTMERAIQAVADPEVVECNLMVMPGITNETITGKLISACEDRADALAIIDLKGAYKPFTESTESDAARIGNVTTTISNLNNRQLSTSYGCAYYPWVQMRDSNSSRLLYIPPSIVALGTFASSENKSAVWFAPAGFQRGGLGGGAAGVAITGVRERLTSKQRDQLYEANVNPIASFPSEGIVVFGQKTLQLTPSALDRINVRRLMIFIKKEISVIANEILFDQNVSATWTRFKSKAVPFLEEVKAGLGLTDFKVILDTTTTTPDLVDRNIMYAKIFLKPARAIEFIAIDFMITNTGAAFDD